MANKDKNKNGAAAASADSAPQNPAVDALNETLKKVEASLLPAVDSFCVGPSKSKTSSDSDGDVESGLPPPSARGLDFMHVKNTLLLSYLIDLTVHLRDAVVDPSDGESKEAESDDEHDENEKKEQREKQRRRLLEMRTVLEKSRGLDKKLRYQIDKLLSSLTDSSAFATGAGSNNEDDNSDGEDDGITGDNGQDDPLRHRPDPKSMLDSDKDDSSDENSDDEDDDEDSVDDMYEEEDEDEDEATPLEPVAAPTEAPVPVVDSVPPSGAPAGVSDAGSSTDAPTAAESSGVVVVANGMSSCMMVLVGAAAATMTMGL
mmetsp:Transcript_29832/g.70243  ORF Transcript_29832/g.70243 Transcript_29832/m.70243 type:complete len:317 (-) Transcript_29832:490-1440(-)